MATAISILDKAIFEVKRAKFKVPFKAAVELEVIGVFRKEAIASVPDGDIPWPKQEQAFIVVVTLGPKVTA